MQDLRTGLEFQMAGGEGGVGMEGSGCWKLKNKEKKREGSKGSVQYCTGY